MASSKEKRAEYYRTRMLDPMYAESRRESSRKWARENYHRKEEFSPDHKRNNFSTYLKRKYSLSVEEYAWMLNSQDGKCASCRDVLGLDKFTHVDHDHETGDIRGILCNGCNTALGLLKDSEDRICNLLNYLRNSRGN